MGINRVGSFVRHLTLGTCVATWLATSRKTSAALTVQFVGASSSLRCFPNLNETRPGRRGGLGRAGGKPQDGKGRGRKPPLGRVCPWEGRGRPGRPGGQGRAAGGAGGKSQMVWG